MIRTPREAKQQLLDDIVGALRATPFKYSRDESPIVVVQRAKENNRAVITAVAKKHGLVIPPKTI